ncbi:hypothetical protein NL676_012042 [Syzygium grande]|nr:hypothetical protein NL676_012042 [Syzygium grande]
MFCHQLWISCGDDAVVAAYCYFILEDFLVPFFNNRNYYTSQASFIFGFSSFASGAHECTSMEVREIWEQREGENDGREKLHRRMSEAEAPRA